MAHSSQWLTVSGYTEKVIIEPYVKRACVLNAYNTGAHASADLCYIHTPVELWLMSLYVGEIQLWLR